MEIYEVSMKVQEGSVLKCYFSSLDLELDLTFICIHKILKI